MNVPYILVLCDNNYAFETKYLNDSKNLPPVGEKVKTHYNEVLPFFNVCGLADVDGTLLTINENILTRISNEEVQAKTKVYLENFLNLMNDSDDIDLLGKNKDLFKSVVSCVESSFDFKCELTKLPFDNVEYINTYNQLLNLSNLTYLRNNAMLIKTLLISTNTILAMNNKIPHSKNALFYTFEDKDELIYMDYGVALNKLKRLESYSEKIKP